MNSNRKIFIIIISVIVVAIIGGNVYASTKGYKNIYFMIKYIFTEDNDGEVVGKDNILSDRDITISNVPININEDVKIQIGKIQIKDNQGKLFLSILKNRKDLTNFDAEYKVYDEKDNALLCDRKINTEFTKMKSSVTETLDLKGFTNTAGKLRVEVYDKDQKLVIIRIDLLNREIVVESENKNNSKVEEISEIDLKAYLDHVPMINNANKNNDEILKLYIAESYYYDVLIDKLKEQIDITDGDFDETTGEGGITYFKEKIDIIADSMGISKIKPENNTNKNIDIDVRDLNTQEIYYTSDKNPQNPETSIYTSCIDVIDLEYKDGEYKVTFDYYYYYLGINYEADNYPVYEMTASFVLNEDKEFVSKYKLTKVHENKLIREGKDGVDFEFPKELGLNQVDDSRLKPIFKTESYKGINFKYAENLEYKPYKLEGENSIEGITLEGKLSGRSIKDNSMIDTNVFITIMEPRQATQEEANEINAVFSGGFVSDNGDIWNLSNFSTEDENVERFRSVDKENVVRDIYFTYDQPDFYIKELEVWFLDRVEIDKNYNGIFNKFNNKI